MTSNSDKMGLRYAPMAFTEQGVAMLSSVVNSPRAIEVNIAIMRTFVLIRKHAIEHQDFNKKLNVLETKDDKKFGDIYEALNYLLQREESEKKQKERKQIDFNKS